MMKMWINTIYFKWNRKSSKEPPKNTTWTWITEGFHLYYFKVFLSLNIFSPKPQRAVCPVQLKLSFQFSSGYSSSDQFSSIHFNSVCFTWKWLTLLTATSYLLSVSCTPTGLLLHHQQHHLQGEREATLVCAMLKRRHKGWQEFGVCKGNNSFFFFSLCLSECHQTAVIWKPHISKKSTFKE